MELKEFISSTLTQIADGVRDAQKHYSEIGGEVNPSNLARIQGNILQGTESTYNGKAIMLCNVHFDVALTSEKTSSGVGGIAVQLGGFSIGGKKNGTDTDSSLNRISFDIPVKLPTM